MDNKKTVKILSIETSGSTCGAALAEDGIISADYSIFGRNLHDKMLAVFVRRLLADNSFLLEDVDAISISAGPGSFTGLRIGSSLAKGICFEDKPRLIAVPTLDAFVFDLINNIKQNPNTEIAAIVPSHKDLIYIQKFNITGTPESEILQISIKDLNQIVSDKAVLTGKIPMDIKHKHQYYKDLSPKLISNLAYELYKENKFVKAEDFVPLYVQEFNPKIR
ncbi:MAG: tRNA threonylcarbamoyladenosine biosynthesis protein TsaB [Bacteroidota bacterium]|nr:tRNA threonylcarbamoyladenosine biosynthesis protein TsaB [Bacteroidota bacterium]